MWGTRLGQAERVTCVACGQLIGREDAREYDKEGDRWTRNGKEFEYLCKTCYRDLNHQPRDGLEGLLVEIERSRQPRMNQAEFLRHYTQLVEERYGTL